MTGAPDAAQPGPLEEQGQEKTAFGCSGQIHTGGLVNDRCLLLAALEAVVPQIEVPADLVSGESPLPGSQTAVFSRCPHVAEREGELSGVSLQGHQSHA